MRLCSPWEGRIALEEYQRTSVLCHFLAGIQAAFGSLISIGLVPLAGQGLGAVQTALTFTSPGASTTESGCVAAGIGGITITGPTACPAGFAGRNDVAINNTYTATSLGLTDFNNFQLIFNPNEPQAAPSEHYAR